MRPPTYSSISLARGLTCVNQLATSAAARDTIMSLFNGHDDDRCYAIDESAEALGDSGNHSTMAMCSGKDEVRFGWAWLRVAESGLVS